MEAIRASRSTASASPAGLSVPPKPQSFVRAHDIGKGDSVEAELVERERSLFNLDASIYLYDLTFLFRGPGHGQPQGQARS